MRMTSKSTRTAVGALCAAALAVMTIGGCAIPGYLAAQFAPPKKVKPVYELPKDKTVLVLVDAHPRISYPTIKYKLIDDLEAQLLAHKVAAVTVPQAKLQKILDDAGSDASDISIGRLGTKLNADYVLYVRIESFSTKDEPSIPLFTGRMKAAVKIVDPQEGRLFPEVQNEFLMKPVQLAPEDNSSETFSEEIARRVSLTMADKIAKLFYEHEVPNTGKDPE